MQPNAILQEVKVVGSEQRNKIYVSGYFGQDRFFLKDKEDTGDRARTGIYWGNATGTLRWNHLFNDRLFANA